MIYEIYGNLTESNNRYNNFKNEQRLQKTLSLNDRNYTGIIGKLQYFPVFSFVSIEYCIRIQKCDRPFNNIIKYCNGTGWST